MKPIIESIIAGVSANLITAIIIWILLEKRANKKAKIENELNNKRIIKSELLSQYPTVINSNLNMQYLAFKIANIRNNKNVNIRATLHAIMNDLRHIANTHWSSYELLVSLGTESKIIEPFAQLSNEIAVISIELFRNHDCSNFDMSTFSKWYSKVQASVVIEWKNSSHWERIERLLNNLTNDCKIFNSLQMKRKLELFINMGEAMGHLSCLNIDSILYSFKNEMEKLK